MLSDRRKHTGKNLEAQVLFVAQTVGASLKDPDFVVEAFDETESNFVLGFAVGRNSIPVVIDHGGELLVGSQTLPFQGCAPVLEKATCPAFGLVVPELSECLFEHIGSVQAFVGFEQKLQGLAALAGKVLSVRKQRKLLAFDEASILAGQPRILALAHRVQRLSQMAYDMELVEQNTGLRSVLSLQGGLSEGLPHIHNGKPNRAALPRPQPREELVHALFRAVLAPKPDRPAPHQVAHDDAIRVSFRDRYLVDADHFRAGPSQPAELFPHVLHLQRLDRLPVQMRFLGHIFDRRGPTPSSHKVGEALGVKRTVRQPVQALRLHGSTAPAIDAPDFQFQVDPVVSTRQVSHSAQSAIVPTALDVATGTTSRFFPRRCRRITRAFGSPKMPRTVELGRKPAKRYASHKRLYLCIRNSYQIFTSLNTDLKQCYQPSKASCMSDLPTV